MLNNKITRRAIIPLLLALPLAYLFRHALFFGELFAFRDAGFYYFPLYQYVQQQWQQGIPLWNPLDGIGQPLLADPTAAVFYPGKLIFLLPASYQWCFACYLFLHAWLAGVGSYVVARKLRSPVCAALLAGLSFELSGSVLFQYCNPIYLVGAAWLPWAILCFLHLCEKKNGVTATVMLSMVLSMMVLGGEPQMAVHFVLCAFVWLALNMRSRLAKNPRVTHFKKFQWTVMGLFAAVGFALLMSAVQVLPSKELASLSDRGVRTYPTSMWEMAAQRSTETKGLWERPQEKGHQSKVYDFSVGPWRWSELFWPNIGGHFGPISTRWLRALPAEGRMWSPSLYLGVLPICLALAAIRFTRGSPTTIWLSWLFLLSVLAAMGEYGLGWLADELQFLEATDEADFQPSNWKRGLGGLYWFLTATVPGYADFRYPAKWWTVTSLSLSVLAAKGWPVLFSHLRKKTLQRFATFATLGLVVTLACRFVVIGEIQPSNVYGPFDEILAWQHLLMSIAHTAIIFLIIILLVQTHQRSSHSPYWRSFALWSVCLCELTLAQSRFIYTAKPHADSTNDPRTFLRGHVDFPSQFRNTSSTNRFQELHEFEQYTKQGKHHLAQGARLLDPICSMRIAEFAEVLKEVKADKKAADPFGVGETLKGKARAWIVHDWITVGDTERSPDAPTDHRRRVTLSAGPNVPLSKGNGAGPSNSECEITLMTNSRIEIAIKTDRTGLLVLCDQFYPGWQATIIQGAATPVPAKIYRTNNVMRSILVPNGNSKVVFDYRPKSFLIGAAISVVAWFGVLAFLLGYLRRGRRLISSEVTTHNKTNQI